MKTRISSNTTWKKYIFASLAATSAFFLIKEALFDQTQDFHYLSILFLCTIILLSFFYLIRKRKHIEFDHDYLYIYNKQTNKRVSFEDIQHLKLLIYRFNNAPTWKIVYNNASKREKVWLISSPKENEALESFINKVEKEHPHIKITEDDEGLL